MSLLRTAARRATSQRAPATGWLRALSGAAPSGPEASMISKLEQSFGTGTKAQVEDVSGGCGSAYNVSVESPFFGGMNKVAQARAVYKVLDEEIAGMHSINVKTKALKQDN